MNKRFLIKGPRQQRAIAALLAGEVAVKDLGVKIGAINPRQIISELRQQGFLGIIKTRRYTTIDRDGKQCRPGEYFISHSAKPLVEKALKEYVAQVRARHQKTTDNVDKSNYSKRK